MILLISFRWRAEICALDIYTNDACIKVKESIGKRTVLQIVIKNFKQKLVDFGWLQMSQMNILMISNDNVHCARKSIPNILNGFHILAKR